MNLLGHNFIAYKVLGTISSDTYIGSHLPDLVPFVKDAVLSFEQIHESPDRLLNFINANFPDKRLLPLAMMCHSVKFGVDKFNRDIETWLLENKMDLRKTIANKISEASGITFEVANGGRLHNYLWSGIEVQILLKQKQFIEELVQARDLMNLNQTAEILNKYFNKENGSIEKNLVSLFTPITTQSLTNLEDYVKYWKIFLAGLPEGDNLDLKKGKALLLFIHETFKDSWDNLIEKVATDVKIRVTPYI